MLKRIYRRTLAAYSVAEHYVYAFQNTRKIGDTLVIILANPRSGSTWLLDMIRCHPSISIHPRYEVYDRLGLEGRRYPRDLSGVSSPSRKIEVTPENWEAVPINCAAAGKRINIEKIHPHFFDHRVSNFIEKIKSFSPECDVRLIYHVRDPKATLVSFLEYKRRNPSWDHRALNEIPSHLRRIYTSILDVSQSVPGLAMDYSTLSADTEAELERAFRFIVEKGTKKPNIQRIRKKTNREKRKAAKNSFVGEKRSGELVNEYNEYFVRHQAEIDRCYDAYNALLNTK
jgi:hypothetical protein